MHHGNIEHAFSDALSILEEGNGVKIDVVKGKKGIRYNIEPIDFGNLMARLESKPDTARLLAYIPPDTDGNIPEVLDMLLSAINLDTSGDAVDVLILALRGTGARIIECRVVDRGDGWSVECRALNEEKPRLVLAPAR